MRRTWDALAGADTSVYVGDPATGAAELEGLFGRLGADPRGGTCVEVGCGPGRMTGALAERFDRVIGLDVSPAMLERAREAVPNENVEFRAVSGERLDGVEDAIADALVCYLVLQHLPSRQVVRSYLARVRARARAAGRGVRPGAGARGRGRALDPPRARARRSSASRAGPSTAPRSAASA